MFGKSTTHVGSTHTLAALDRSQAMIEFAPDGTILTANANFLDAMGYALEEVRGRHHAMFVDVTERDGHEYRTFWTDLRTGTYRSAEFRRRYNELVPHLRLAGSNLNHCFFLLFIFSSVCLFSY